MSDPRRRALVAALLFAALALPAAPARAEDPAPPTRAKPAAPTDEEVLRGLEEKAVPVVERVRGLKFKSIPPASPITREQFLDRNLKDLEKVLGGTEKMAPASRMFARLGVIPAGSDLRKLLAEYLPTAVSANYDPHGKRISFLPGIPRSIQTMIHEMTHALGDQHFDFEKTALGGPLEFDRILAYGALCEGDAESVEYRAGGFLNDTIPFENLRAQGEAMADAILRAKGRTPPALVLAFRSQYLDGVIFVEHLRRSPRRNDAVDEAFRSPPPCTEQVLHPEKYAAGEAPFRLLLPKPPGEARVLVDTSLGELGTSLVFIARGSDPAAARAVAAGWGGDRVALVGYPGGVEALLWVSWWDDATEAEAFEKALQGAFPQETGEAAPARTVMRRGQAVIYAEASKGVLEECVALAQGCSREPGTPTPRKDVLPVPKTAPAASPPGGEKPK